jgi:Holliday junction DNA helicase RuvA
MRDRLDDWQSDGVLPVALATTTPTSTARDEERDALSALISLGYKPPEASRLISGVESDGLTSEEIIRAALKLAVKR